MSVRIIGFDKSFVKTVICKNCGAILEYLNKDVYVYSGLYTPDMEYEYIKCPSCKRRVVL